MEEMVVYLVALVYISTHAVLCLRRSLTLMNLRTVERVRIPSRRKS